MCKRSTPAELQAQIGAIVPAPFKYNYRGAPPTPVCCGARFERCASCNRLSLRSPEARNADSAAVQSVCGSEEATGRCTVFLSEGRRSAQTESYATAAAAPLGWATRDGIDA